MDNVGLIIRTVNGVYVCYVKSLGKLLIVPYSDFLADSNNIFIKLRLKDNLQNEIENENYDLYENNKLDTSKTTSTNPGIIEFFEKLKSNSNKYSNSLEVIEDYFNTMKMCNNKNIITKGKIDSSYPLCLSKKDGVYTYSRSFIIRTNQSEN